MPPITPGQCCPSVQGSLLPIMHSMTMHHTRAVLPHLCSCMTPRQCCPITAHGMPSKGAWAAER
eukprot:6981629-Lingulodinium_polyedra.AAC.1